MGGTIYLVVEWDCSPKMKLIAIVDLSNGKMNKYVPTFCSTRSE